MPEAPRHRAEDAPRQARAGRPACCSGGEGPTLFRWCVGRSPVCCTVGRNGSRCAGATRPPDLPTPLAHPTWPTQLGPPNLAPPTWPPDLASGTWPAVLGQRYLASGTWPAVSALIACRGAIFAALPPC